MVRVLFDKGVLRFLLLGDQYFSSYNTCAPLSTTLPSLEHSEIMNSIFKELKRLLGLIGYETGGLNIEIIRDPDDRLFFIEVGARNGGNLMPDLAYLASGFDLVKANVNAVLNEPVDFSISTIGWNFIVPRLSYIVMLMVTLPELTYPVSCKKISFKNGQLFNWRYSA